MDARVLRDRLDRGESLREKLERSEAGRKKLRESLSLLREHAINASELARRFAACKAELVAEREARAEAEARAERAEERARRAGERAEREEARSRLAGERVAQVEEAARRSQEAARRAQEAARQAEERDEERAAAVGASPVGSVGAEDRFRLVQAAVADLGAALGLGGANPRWQASPPSPPAGEPKSARARAERALRLTRGGPGPAKASARGRGRGRGRAGGRGTTAAVGTPRTTLGVAEAGEEYRLPSTADECRLASAADGAPPRVPPSPLSSISDPSPPSSPSASEAPSAASSRLMGDEVEALLRALTEGGGADAATLGVEVAEAAVREARPLPVLAAAFEAATLDCARASVAAGADRPVDGGASSDDATSGASGPRASAAGPPPRARFRSAWLTVAALRGGSLRRLAAGVASADARLREVAGSSSGEPPLAPLVAGRLSRSCLLAPSPTEAAAAAAGAAELGAAMGDPRPARALLVDLLASRTASAALLPAAALLDAWPGVLPARARRANARAGEAGESSGDRDLAEQVHRCLHTAALLTAGDHGGGGDDAAAAHGARRLRELGRGWGWDEGDLRDNAPPFPSSLDAWLCDGVAALVPAG